MEINNKILVLEKLKKKKMNRHILILIVFITTINAAMGQSLRNSNLYTVNPTLINPAAYVNDNLYRVYLNSHMQWIGVPGAPRNNIVGFGMSPTRNIGVGISISNDRIGLFNYLDAHLKYAYRANFDVEHYLNMGLSAGISNNRMLLENIEHADLSDITIGEFDQTTFSSGFGFQYKLKNLEAQVILPNIYNNSKLNFHNITFLSYEMGVNDEWNIRPSILMRNSDVLSYQTDLNLMAIWQKAFWIQAGYRTNQSYLFSAGVCYNNYEIGYAYQFDSKPLSTSNSGSHEIQLVYRFQKPDAGKEASKTQLVGRVLNKADNSAVKAQIIVSDILLNKSVEIFTDNHGFYKVDVYTNRNYNFIIEADDFKSTLETVIVENSLVSRERNFLLEPEYVSFKGKIINALSREGIITEVKILEGNKLIANILSNSSGEFSVKLSKNRQYNILINADNYLSINETIQSGESSNIEKLFLLNPALEVFGRATNSKTGRPVGISITIYDSRTNQFVETVQSDPQTGYYVSKFNGIESINIVTSSDEHMFFFETVNLNTTKGRTEKNIKLEPLEVGAKVVLNNVQFPSGNSVVQSEAKAELDNLVATMNAFKSLIVEISGHTDNVGRSEYNRELSFKRAQSVVDYMVSQGIERRRLIAVGYGDAIPRTSNDTEDGKYLNRRVEAKIIGN